MKLIEKQVIKLIDEAIHGRKTHIDGDVEWDKIIEEGKAHNIEALLYSAIESKSIKNIDEELLKSWKLTTFNSGVNQLQHIKNVSSILNLFRENNIPVIALKGLVIRKLYPRPELRTMCDADLLVHKKDLDKSEELLIEEGYTLMVGSDLMHHAYYKNNTHIELHWTISNERYFEGIPQIEKSVWENAVEVAVGDSKALSMNDEDMAVHLCLHMASHLINRGFGIRQICDLVLLIDKKGQLINWDGFIEKIRLCNIETFAKTIFLICNKLFSVNIPKQLKADIKPDVVEDLIEDIFSNGVHGKRDGVAALAKQISYDRNFSNKSERSIYTRYFDALFPKIETMECKFNYAKKYKVLTPIAWIHHFCIWVSNSDYTMKDKLKFATSSVSICEKRNNLIKELEL